MAIVHTFTGPSWWGVVVLVALPVIGAAAWRTGRTGLAGCAAVTFALSAGAVAAIGAVPGSQFLVVGYLGALWVPVGTAVWVTFGWAAGEVATAAVRRRRRRAGTDGPPDGSAARRAAVAVTVLLVAGSAGVVWRGVDRMDGIVPTLAGWPAVHAAADGADAAARVAPRGTFRLEVAGPGSAAHFAVVTGVAYLLVTRGFDPRPDSPVAWATFGRPPDRGPTVVLEVPDGGGSVRARLRNG